MAAKLALSRIIRDGNISQERMFDDALSSARENHMGVDRVINLREELFGERGSTSDNDLDVRGSIQQLVSLAISRRQGPQNDHADVCILEHEGPEGEAHTQPILSDGTISDADNKNCESTNTTTLGVTGSEPSCEDTVHVPASLLIKLLDKIDALESTVNSQREELRDVEKRLKQDIKLREKRLTEQITNLALDLTRTESIGPKNTSRGNAVDKTRSNTNAPRPQLQHAQQQNGPKYHRTRSSGQDRSTGKFAEPVPEANPISEPERCMSEEDTSTCTRKVELQIQHLAKKAKPDVDGTTGTNLNPGLGTHPVSEPNPQPGQWHVVQRKKAVAELREKKKPLGKLVGALRVKKQVFYLGGISTECSSEDVVSFCGDSCPLIECRIMRSKRNGTQAARIVVSESNGQTLECLEWPKHVYLRRWTFEASWGPHEESQ